LESSKRRKDELAARKAQLLGNLTEQMKSIMTKLSDETMPEAKREAMRTLLLQTKDQMDKLGGLGTGYGDDPYLRPSKGKGTFKGKGKGTEGDDSYTPLKGKGKGEDDDSYPSLKGKGKGEDDDSYPPVKEKGAGVEDNDADPSLKEKEEKEKEKGIEDNDADPLPKDKEKGVEDIDSDPPPVVPSPTVPPAVPPPMPAESAPPPTPSESVPPPVPSESVPPAMSSELSGDTQRLEGETENDLKHTSE